MAKHIKPIYIIGTAISLGLWLSACSADTAHDGTDNNGEAPLVEFIARTCDNDISAYSHSSRAGERAETDPREIYPVGRDFIEGTSRIRVCSVTRDVGSANRVPAYDIPFNEGSSYPTDYNRYHEYICQKRMEYEEYSIFTTYKSEDGSVNSVPLKWYTIDPQTHTPLEGSGNILQNKADGGHYFFAAMYPFTYERPGSGNLLSVKYDQTFHSDIAKRYNHYAADLLLNDIRLCQKLIGRDKYRTPIRLDFFHSLCMLVVNVEIPMFRSTDGLGFTKESIINNKIDMTLKNISRSYSPNYETAYDSEDAIIVNADESQQEDFINMFHNPMFNYPEPNSTNKNDPNLIKQEYCYWEQEQDHEGNQVPVIWMQFCAILPQQNLSQSDSYILFNIGGQTYRCDISNFTIDQISQSLTIKQGCVSILTLYIPRGQSDAILIGAKLKDWNKKRTPIIPLQ